ncbi:MAG: WYL domain-containing protein [Clostridiales bacterium]|nr:WYL domain-containing protein [Clostridiales bacterium]
MTKLKLLYLLRIFQEKSDETHILSTTDLIQELKGYGIACDRKSIYSDIDALIAYGYDIVKTSSPRKAYFLASHVFELPELRLLCDAVRSCSSITPRKSDQMVRKLCGFMNEYQRSAFETQSYLLHRMKTRNEEVLYTIDALQEAIVQGRQVRLSYRKRALHRESGACCYEQTYTVHPYGLIWDRDRYYFICRRQRESPLLYLPVDRIRKVQMLDQSCRVLHNMQTPLRGSILAQPGGEQISVELLCNMELYDEMLDCFGDQVPHRRADAGRFWMEVPGSVSQEMVTWLLQYGDKVKIQSPEALRKLYLRRLSGMVHLYH